ncbi:MAG: hypothetical protein ABFR47_09080, partial [Verrucomicrobiota bacterium]
MRNTSGVDKTDYIDGGERVTCIPGPVTYTLNGGPPQIGQFRGFTEIEIQELVLTTDVVDINGTGYPNGTHALDFLSPLAVRSAPTTKLLFTNLKFVLSAEPDLGTTTNLVVEAPSAAAIDVDRATLGATTLSGTNVTSYGTGYYLPGGVTNVATIAGTPTNGVPFSHERTGMTPGTLYHARGWASNSVEGVVWASMERAFLTEPLQVTTAAVDFVEADSMLITWSTDASADGVVVVVSTDGPVSGVPGDDGTYTGNATYGFGDTLGNGSVVYAGSDQSVHVTGLPGSPRDIAVFAYSSAGGLINYQQDAPETLEVIPEFNEVGIFNLDHRMVATSDAGTLVTTLTSGTLDVDSELVYTLNITDADFDGDGNATDTATMTVTVTALTDGSSPVLRNTSSLGYFGVDSSLGDGNKQVNYGEALQITPGPVTYTLNGGPSQAGSFLGFKGARVYFPWNHGGTWTWNGGTNTYPVMLGSTDMAMNGTSPLKFEWTVGTAGSDQRLSVSGIDFSISTVSGSATTGEVMAVSQPEAVSVDTNSAVLGATLDTGSNVTSYGVEYILPGVSTHRITKVGTPTNGIPFTVNADSLLGATLYHMRGWASNALQGVVWTSDEETFITEPQQATSAELSEISGSSMKVSWTPGSDADGS